MSVSDQRIVHKDAIRGVGEILGGILACFQGALGLGQIMRGECVMVTLIEDGMGYKACWLPTELRGNIVLHRRRLVMVSTSVFGRTTWRRHAP